MQYGSIFGRGAYLGPDFTDDYLHRAALSVRDRYGGPRSNTAAQKTISDFQANHYDAATDTLTHSAARAAAFRKLRSHYASFFGNPTTKFGLRPDAITDPRKIEQLTAFVSWSPWAWAARRPATTTHTQDQDIVAPSARPAHPGGSASRQGSARCLS